MKNVKLYSVLLLFVLSFAFFSFKPTTSVALASDDGDESEQSTQETYIYAYPWVANGIKPDEPVDPVEPVEPIGPIGGTFTAVMTDPKNPDIVYGGHFLAGVFKSYDQGATWYEKNQGLNNLQIQSLAIHPRHTNIIYVGTYGNGIYLSRNGGDSWEPWNGGVLNNHIIYDIEIDPTNPSIVYSASRIQGSLVGYLSRSTDAGLNWSIVFRGDRFETPDYFYAVKVHPGGINTVFLATHEHGFYRSQDNGLSFLPVNSGVHDYSARGFALNVAYRNLVLGSVWKGSGVYRSWNTGNDWQQTRNGLPTEVRITKIQSAPTTTGVDSIFVTTHSNGLYSSDNFGDNWIHRGLGDSHINDIAISYFNPQIWYVATQHSGMLRTKNSGRDWFAVMDDLRLYSVTGIQSLAHDPQALYISIYGMGVYRFEPSLKAWQLLDAGMGELGVTGLYSSENELWATSANALWVLNDGTWQAIALPEAEQTNQKALIKWQTERLGMVVENMQEDYDVDIVLNNDIAIAPKLSATYLLTYDDQLFIGTANGVWMKQGTTWTQIGLEKRLVNALTVDETDYSLWASACDDTGLCQACRLENGRWTELSGGLQNVSVNHLRFTDKRLFIASQNGIYLWDRELGTWKVIGAEGQNVLQINQKVNSPEMLIAGAEGYVLMSEDSGDNWRLIGTSENWRYQFLSFYPGDNVKILLGSMESGAFTLEANQ